MTDPSCIQFPKLLWIIVTDNSTELSRSPCSGLRGAPAVLAEMGHKQWFSKTHDRPFSLLCATGHSIRSTRPPDTCDIQGVVRQWENVLLLLLRLRAHAKEPVKIWYLNSWGLEELDTWPLIENTKNILMQIFRIDSFNVKELERSIRWKALLKQRPDLFHSCTRCQITCTPNSMLEERETPWSSHEDAQVRNVDGWQEAIRWAILNPSDNLALAKDNLQITVSSIIRNQDSLPITSEELMFNRHKTSMSETFCPHLRLVRVLTTCWTVPKTWRGRRSLRPSRFYLISSGHRWSFPSLYETSFLQIVFFTSL